MSKRIVSDEDMERALHFLAQNAVEIGEARRRMLETDALMKRTEAMLFLSSTEKNAEARKAAARASDKWIEASTEAAIAAGEFQKNMALREAAAARIEAWRSESANYRGMRV